ncbi:hypothetical protein E2320_013064 [Naja naja]|nr:hypothetical protein E2320_013064 [Naja naja]
MEPAIARRWLLLQSYKRDFRGNILPCKATLSRKKTSLASSSEQENDDFKKPHTTMTETLG